MSEIYLSIQVQENGTELCNPIMLRFPDYEKTSFLSGKWEGKEGSINHVLNLGENIKEISRLLDTVKEKKCELEFRLLEKLDENEPRSTTLGPKPIPLDSTNENMIMVFIKSRLSASWLNSISEKQKTKGVVIQPIIHLLPRPKGDGVQIKILEEAQDLALIDAIIIHPIAEKEASLELQTIKVDNSFGENLPVGKESERSKKELEINLTTNMKDTAPKKNQRKLPHIIVRRKALECAKEHARAEQDRETGGVLLGQFLPKGESDTVIVTGIVRGMLTIRRTASLTFTPATWAQIWSWMDTDPVYSDETTWSMVGWYHTHPSFGIFLSSYDLFIHKNHFQRPEHIALVIDPKRKEEGFFGWNLPMTDIIPYKKYEIKDDDEIQKILKLNELKDLPVPEILDPSRKI